MKDTINLRNNFTAIPYVDVQLATSTSPRDLISIFT